MAKKKKSSKSTEALEAPQSLTNIVDTNVILAANEAHQDLSPQCILNCATRLQSIMTTGRIALDDQHRILNEYGNKTNANQAKKPGDAFVKWALRNRSNSSKCDLVPLTEHKKRGFDSFPDDKDLSNFDDPDRKFVAVAAAHPDHPPILQAADSKWLNWEAALNRHGVSVIFVCEEDIRRFHEKKFGK